MHSEVSQKLNVDELAIEVHDEKIFKLQNLNKEQAQLNLLLQQEVEALKKVYQFTDKEIKFLKLAKLDSDIFFTEQVKVDADTQYQKVGLCDLSNRIKAVENYVHTYMPYNLFVKIQNYLHMAFRSTTYLDRCKEYE